MHVRNSLKFLIIKHYPQNKRSCMLYEYKAFSRRVFRNTSKKYYLNVLGKTVSEKCFPARISKKWGSSNHIWLKNNIKTFEII